MVLFIKNRTIDNRYSSQSIRWYEILTKMQFTMKVFAKDTTQGFHTNVICFYDNILVTRFIMEKRISTLD